MTDTPGRLSLPGRVLSHHLVVAGVLDAAVSSSATFLAGLTATRVLAPDVLGLYALAFSVFIFSGFVPAQLIFTSTEIMAVDYPRHHQLPLLRMSLARGAVVSFLAAVVTSAWVLVAPTNPGGALPPLALTCALATFISPIQDHLRRMLHVAGESWRAVAVAVVQLAGVLVAVVGMTVAGVAPVWVPFGSLVIANLISLCVGLLLSLRELLADGPQAPISTERLLHSGRPLLLIGILPSAASFAVSWLVAALAGAATLGLVEAGRIVSQPVQVLQVGLGGVLGPRATRASSQRDERTARRVVRQFRTLILAAGFAWLVVVGLPGPWNPLPALLPNAYVLPGIVAAWILGLTLMNLSEGLRLVLFGARRERQVVRAELEGNAARLAVAGGVPLLGGYAVPLGLAVLGLVRAVRAERWVAEYFAEEGRAPSTPAATADAAEPAPGTAAPDQFPAGDTPAAVVDRTRPG